MRRRMEKIGSRTVPTEFDSGRLSTIAIGARDGVAAAEESRPVRFEFRRADGFAVDDRQMRGPDFRVARRPLSPRRQDRADVGEIFRLDEQLGEGRMRDVGALGREHEFGIGGDLDVARAASGVGDRDPANLGVVLGGDDHVQCRRQRAVASRELGAVLVEGDVIGVRLDAGRLEARRPGDAAAQVLDSRCRSRSRRRSRPRASASAPDRPSGCIRSRRRSASSRSGRSTADAWRASLVAPRRTAGRPTARRCGRRPPTSRPPPKVASPRRRAACAPAAAVRSP